MQDPHQNSNALIKKNIIMTTPMPSLRALGKLDKLFVQTQKMNKRLQASQKTTRRLKKKVSSLQAVVNELRQKNLISGDSATILEPTFSGVNDEKVGQAKEEQECGAYPPELRAFALTLKFSRLAFLHAKLQIQNEPIFFATVSHFLELGNEFNS